MNKLDIDYCNLLQDILDNGVKKQTRNGETLSVFGRTIRHKMSEGFPILTTKKIAFKTMIAELLFFLKGQTDIRELWKNNCHIWDGDFYKRYEKSCSTPYSLEELIEKQNDTSFHSSMWDLGSIYGAMWRNWKHYGKINADEKGQLKAELNFPNIDQIANLINDLKINPDSRRLMVSAWNPAELENQILPPCHYSFQCYTRELTREERWDWLRKECWGKSKLPWDRMAFPSHEWMDKVETINSYDLDFKKHEGITISVPRRAISLIWNQRSADTFLGLPFNIASYGLLLEILAKEVNMVPDELIGNLGDCHLYLNHIEQAKEQIGKELTITERRLLFFNKVKEKWSNISIQFDISDVDKEMIPKRTREPYPLPKLLFKSHLKDFKSLLNDETYGVVYRVKDFILDNYQSHPKIEAPLSN